MERRTFTSIPHSWRTLRHQLSWCGWGFINNAHEVKLSRFGLREREKFSYEYDFFSNWKPQIRVEAILPDDNEQNYPLCTAGKGACPPENCGGVAGFITLRQKNNRVDIALRVG